MNTINIPISVGELLDKISILSIKSRYTDNHYVHKELFDLIEISKKYQVYDSLYIEQLLKVNQKLWQVEDELRVLEKKKKFDKNFIDLARLVYINNDKRSSIKKEINIKYNSTYKEVKLYS